MYIHVCECMCILFMCVHLCVQTVHENANNRQTKVPKELECELKHGIDQVKQNQL